jgi:hypothetical protein
MKLRRSKSVGWKALTSGRKPLLYATGVSIKEMSRHALAQLAKVHPHVTTGAFFTPKALMCFAIVTNTHQKKTYR